MGAPSPPDCGEPSIMEEPAFVQGRRRGPGWSRVAYGLHVPTGAQADASLHALASQLHKGAGFTHLTAARIRGWWLPPLPAGLPEFAAQNNRNRPRRPELRIVRTTPVPEISQVDGLPVVSPTDALLAVARHLGLLDVVVILDGALHAGDVSPDAARRGSPGATLRGAPAAATPPCWLIVDRSRRTRPCCGSCTWCATSPSFRSIELWAAGHFVARGDLRLAGHVTPSTSTTDAVHRTRERASLATSAVSATSVRLGGCVGATPTSSYCDARVEILRDADRALGRAHDSVAAWSAGTPC